MIVTACARNRVQNEIRFLKVFFGEPPAGSKQQHVGIFEIIQAVAQSQAVDAVCTRRGSGDNGPDRF